MQAALHKSISSTMCTGYIPGSRELQGKISTSFRRSLTFCYIFQAVLLNIH